jgi:hypothetical protein
MRTQRFVAATGALYVVAVLVGNALAEPPMGDGQSPLGHLQEGRTPTQTIGVALEVLSFAALLVFLGYLYRVLRRAGTADAWAAGAFGAGLTTVAIKLASAAPVMVAYHRADALSPELARTLDDLSGAAFVVTGYTWGIFVALAAAAASTARVLPRWLSVAGLVIGVLTVAAGVAGVLEPRGYVPIPFLLGLGWVLVISVVLAVRGAEQPAARVDGAVREGLPASA